MHYRDVFVSLNSAQRHTVGDLQVSTNEWEYGSPTTIKQLPAGTIYMDIGYWDGPWPRFGSNIREMEAADLSEVFKTNDEEKTVGLITRKIEFHKWGRYWSIMIYMRTPVSEKNRQLMERVLKSFRFDGVPAGDEIWAIGFTPSGQRHRHSDGSPTQRHLYLQSPGRGPVPSRGPVFYRVAACGRKPGRPIGAADGGFGTADPDV